MPLWCGKILVAFDMPNVFKYICTLQFTQLQMVDRRWERLRVEVEIPNLYRAITFN
jgi:hypothetical protein